MINLWMLAQLMDLLNREQFYSNKNNKKNTLLKQNDLLQDYPVSYNSDRLELAYFVQYYLLIDQLKHSREYLLTNY